MKILITTLILSASFPVNAHESIGDHIHREAYESQKGYAYENKGLVQRIKFFKENYPFFIIIKATVTCDSWQRIILRLLILNK